MTFEQLKQFLEIVRCGSINQAAANLFMSQAALSMSIKKFEREMRHQIFLRNNQGVQLTDFGRDILSYIAPVCDQMNLLEKLCLHNGNRTHESLAVCGSGFRLISALCAELYHLYKPLGIYIYNLEHMGDETIDVVASHQADIGFIRIWDCYQQLYTRQMLTKKLRFVPLGRRKICVTVGKGNPLYACSKETIKAAELAEFPIIVYPYLDSGPYSDIFNRLGLTLNGNRLIANSQAVIYDMLNMTDGFYISSELSDIYQKLDIKRSVRNIVLENCSLQSVFGWIAHEDYQMSAPAKEFVKRLTCLFSG